jgi:hypothetical protein
MEPGLSSAKAAAIQPTGRAEIGALRRLVNRHAHRHPDPDKILRDFWPHSFCPIKGRG